MFDIVGRLVLDAAQAEADAGGNAREVLDHAGQQDDDGIRATGNDELALGRGGVELIAVEGVAEGVHRAADAAADVNGVGGGGEASSAAFEQGVAEGGAEAAEGMADGGGRKGQFFRGARNRAVIQQREEHAEQV